MATAFEHVAVMVDEIVAFFAPVPPGLVLDATVGAGHHAEAVLAAHPDLQVLGLDRDPAAVAAATARLAPFAERAIVRRARFDALGDEVARTGAGALSGFLFDLGVSSPQIDEADRGFSYRLEGPLDMRMDPAQERTAAQVVNTYSVDELADVLRWYGDVPAAGRVARSIVDRRPLTTTAELADAVRHATPARDRRRGDPAKRVFQAVRIEVNDELDVLGHALDAALDLLRPAGRGAVLSYHSGEDRLVKERFRRRTHTGDDRRRPTLTPDHALVWRGGRTPSAAEQARNPRSSSARLRGIERVDR